MNTFEDIIKELPADYVKEMGAEALESIYLFCEKLGLNDCETWEDVTEPFGGWLTKDKTEQDYNISI